MNKSILYLLICILISLPVLSLTIEYPNVDYIKQNTDYSFIFYTYDINNQLINSDCNFSLFELNGSIIYNSISSNGIFYLSSNNFSNLGKYYYHIYCNTSLDGGFIDKDIEVTTNGKNKTNTDIFSFAMIFLALIFFTWVLKFVYEQRRENSYGTKTFLISMMIMSAILLVISSLSFVNGNDTVAGLISFKSVTSYFIYIFVACTLTWAVIQFIILLARFAGWKK